MFMQLNEERDVILLREMAARGIFQYKVCSHERGNSWQEIVTLESKINESMRHRTICTCNIKPNGRQTSLVMFRRF